MAKMVPTHSILDKRLEKFLTAVREICRSPQQFKRKIDIQVGHIAFRAAQTGADIRNAMTPEHIASVLLNGKVNEKHSKMANPIELAVEGKFATISYIKFDPIEEIKCRDAAIRVVIREGASKHIVVTLYPLSERDTNIDSVQEVPSNVW